MKKSLPMLWAAVAACASADADTAGLERVDEPVVAGEVSASFVNKVLSYGLVDGDEPLFLPSGSLTFFGWYSAGAIFYMDMTDYGRTVGRGDRSWDFWEIDFPTELRHAFGPEDAAWLPTTVELGAGYRYEYHPPRSHYHDTQFWTFDVSLSDLWLVPTFAYERDTINDNGTYLNLSVCHEFALCETVTLKPVLAQGFGDAKRVRGYLTDDDGDPLDHAGLMDTSVGFDLAWRPFGCLEVSAFVRYNEFLFDREIRRASRHYIADAAGHPVSDTSWHFTGGVSVAYAF